MLGNGGVLADGAVHDVLHGSLFFSTQVNRLFRHTLPGVLYEDELELGGVLPMRTGRVLLWIVVAAALGPGGLGRPRPARRRLGHALVRVGRRAGAGRRRPLRPARRAGPGALPGRRPLRPGHGQPGALRLAAQRQAGHLHRAHLGRRARAGPRLHGRRHHGAGVQLLLRTGALDAVADAGLGRGGRGGRPAGPPGPRPRREAAGESTHPAAGPWSSSAPCAPLPSTGR